MLWSRLQQGIAILISQPSSRSFSSTRHSSFRVQSQAGKQCRSTKRIHLNTIEILSQTVVTTPHLTWRQARPRISATHFIRCFRDRTHQVFHLWPKSDQQRCILEVGTSETYRTTSKWWFIKICWIPSLCSSQVAWEVCSRINSIWVSKFKLTCSKDRFPTLIPTSILLRLRWAMTCIFMRGLWTLAKWWIHASQEVSNNSKFSLSNIPSMEEPLDRILIWL